MSDQGQLDALLSAMEAAGRPSSMSLPRPAGLRNFTELAGWLSGPGSGPAGQDRTIADPSGPLPIRIYGPDRLSSSAAGPGAAAVMFFHGGGWVLGGLDSHDALCRELARQAGMVVVADGSEESERRLERVLTSDPGMGVIRHADAGYEEAVRFARERGIRRPMDA